MKYFSLFGVVLFVLFAIVQINDPDPYIWVPFYLFAASLSFLVSMKRYPVYVLGISALLYLGYSVYNFPPALGQWVVDELNNSSLSMKTPSMEEARESLGSLICFMFLATYVVYFSSVKKVRVS